MIEGRVVRLRALERTDVERAYAWVNDREVTQYLLSRYPMSHAIGNAVSSREASGASTTFRTVAIGTSSGCRFSGANTKRYSQAARKPPWQFRRLSTPATMEKPSAANALGFKLRGLLIRQGRSLRSG